MTYGSIWQTYRQQIVEMSIQLWRGGDLIQLYVRKQLKDQVAFRHASKSQNMYSKNMPIRLLYDLGNTHMGTCYAYHCIVRHKFGHHFLLVIEQGYMLLEEKVIKASMTKSNSINHNFLLLLHFFGNSNQALCCQWVWHSLKRTLQLGLT